MILDGWTFFALTGASFVLSMFVFICGQEDTIKQIKAIGKLILVAFILIIVAMVIYIRYGDIIAKMFQSTYLFHRISYGN